MALDKSLMVISVLEEIQATGTATAKLFFWVNQHQQVLTEAKFWKKKEFYFFAEL